MTWIHLLLHVEACIAVLLGTVSAFRNISQINKRNDERTFRKRSVSIGDSSKTLGCGSGIGGTKSSFTKLIQKGLST